MARKAHATAIIILSLASYTLDTAQADQLEGLSSAEWSFFFGETLPSGTQKEWPEWASPSEWALRLRTPSGIAFVPTTYSTFAECLLAAITMPGTISPGDKPCVPIHFTAESVSAFKEFVKSEKAEADRAREQQRKDASELAAKERARIQQIEHDRPALEAERRAILDDRNKLNQKRYADRVLEIDAILRSIK